MGGNIKIFGNCTVCEEIFMELGVLNWDVGTECCKDLHCEQQY
jgi:hypothetical protein